MRKPGVVVVILAQHDTDLSVLWHVRFADHVIVVPQDADNAALKTQLTLYSGSFTWEVGGDLPDSGRLLFVGAGFVPLGDCLERLVAAKGRVVPRTLLPSTITLQFLDTLGTNLDNYMVRTCHEESASPGAMAVDAAELNNLPELSVIQDAVGVLVKPSLLHGVCGC